MKAVSYIPLHALHLNLRALQVVKPVGVGKVYASFRGKALEAVNREGHLLRCQLCGAGEVFHRLSVSVLMLADIEVGVACPLVVVHLRLVHRAAVFHCEYLQQEVKVRVLVKGAQRLLLCKLHQRPLLHKMFEPGAYLAHLVLVAKVVHRQNGRSSP